MDIDKLDVKELKVLAYDILTVLQENQRNLQLINQMIAKKSQPKKDEGDTECQTPTTKQE